MSNFTQEERDYLILMVREMSDHDREVVGVVLNALADTAWTAEELSEMAKLVRGE